MRILVTDNATNLSDVVKVDYVEQTRTIRVISKANTTDHYDLKDDESIVLKCQPHGDFGCIYVVMPLRYAAAYVHELLQTGYTNLSIFAETTFIEPTYNTPNLAVYFAKHYD